MRVYEVVAEALVEQGVTTVFSLMTSDNMSMLGHLETKGVRIVRARTEYGAVCMADGYARETGDVGVVSIGAGPSAAMTGTALVTARKRRSPLVVIAGDTPPAQRHHLKHFEQHEFFEVTAGHCITSVTARGVLPDAYEVFRRARAGSGPAVLNIPVDLLEAAVDYTEITDLWRFMTPAVAVAPPAAATDVLARVAALLVAAQRPVIVAGRGATDARCRELMLAIGDRIGAVYGSSLQGQYLFDSPYDVGIIGTLGTSSAVRAMSETDCVLVVGASLNAYTSGHGQLFAKAKIIQIDDRPDAFGAETPIDVAVCGDASDTLAALDALLARLLPVARAGFRSEALVAEIAEDFRALAEYEPVQGVLDQRVVLDAISRALPKRRRIVVDAGHFAFFVVDHVRLASPTERIWTADFASIGLAVSVGIGVAAATPEHTTLVFVGDGGFAMSLPELDTAVRHHLPITFVVMDDGAYGAEVRYLENRHEADHLARFESPGWADIARGYGCAALSVRTPAELSAACEQLSRTAAPFLLDIKVDSTVANRQFRGRTTSAAGAG